jgi:hypothetical protein
VCPAGHLTHEAAACSGWNLPVSHDWQLPNVFVLSKYLPASHPTHSCKSELPVLLVVAPAGHWVHDEALLAGWNLPCWQGMQSGTTAHILNPIETYS